MTRKSKREIERNLDEIETSLEKIRAGGLDRADLSPEQQELCTALDEELGSVRETEFESHSDYVVALREAIRRTLSSEQSSLDGGGVA